MTESSGSFELSESSGNAGGYLYAERRELVLRPYQVQAIQDLRAGIRAGHQRQMLVAPTGAGKTIISTSLLNNVQQQFKKAAFVVDRVALCQQTSDMLAQYGIRHGVAQGANTFGRMENIQVCSAQTVEKRGFWPDIDLVIIDEAHTMRKKVSEFVLGVGVPVIGLTATPFSQGLGRIYSNVVNVTTTNQLLDAGFLAPLKVYVATQINMEGAKLRGGEWAEKDIQERGRIIIGDIVSEWRDKTNRHFGGPVKTIVFSASVAHGDELCRSFRAVGFNFQQISYLDGNDDSRQAIIEEFRKPDSSIIGLISCEALAKGFDVPDILCGICARPYRRSFSSHIQMIGRGMRSFPGKEFCIWLDHAGNYEGFYDQMIELFENGVGDLDDDERDKKVRKEVKKEASEISCHSCGYAPILRTMTACPECGRAIERKSLQEIAPGRMVELEAVNLKKHPFLERPPDVWRQICKIASERFPEDDFLAKKFALAQYRNIYQCWPKRAEFDPSDRADWKLRSLVKSNIIRWAKSQTGKVA